MTDRGHSVERCQSGLSAATALVVEDRVVLKKAAEIIRR